MNSERDLRDLRKAIEELTEVFNEIMRGKSDKLRDFDVSMVGYEGKSMLARLQDYGVDPRDPDQLNEMYKSLGKIIRKLENKRTEFDEKVDNGEVADDTLDEIEGVFSRLDASIHIPVEEKRRRKEAFDTKKMTLDADEIDAEIDSQLLELKFDRQAALVMKKIAKNPQLIEMYTDITELRAQLENEEKYRDDQTRLTKRYNELCTAYMTLEKAEKALADPSITPEARFVRETERDKAIRQIDEAMTMPPDEELKRPATEAERNESEKRREAVLGKRDRTSAKNPKDIMAALRGEIEQVAFERNSINGIVDDRVLQRDKFDIERVDLQKQLVDSLDETDKAKREEKQKKLAKTKDLQEYLKIIELQKEIDRLLSELNTKINTELVALENAKDAAQAAFNALTPCDPSNSEYDSKKEALDKAIEAVDRKKSEITTLKQNIIDKVKPFQILGIKNLQLRNFDDFDKAKSAIQGGINRQKEQAEKSAQARKKKALERYGIGTRNMDKDSTADLLKRVDERVTKIRSKYNERHVIRTKEEQEQAEKESNETPPDVGAPQANPGTPGTPVGGRAAPGGVVPPLYGNPAGRTGGVSNPGIRPTVHTPGAPGMGGIVTPPFTGSNLTPDVSEPEVEEYKPANYKNRYLGYQRTLEEVPVDYDIQSQIDELGKQRIEAGKVYRYAKTGDKLLYLEEDLSIYVSNPKAKLASVLDDLRYKLECEFASPKDMKEFLAQEDCKELRGLISKNPLVRMKARHDFMNNLEAGGAMQLANMAIALNSEVLPEKINEVLGRARGNPYTRQSDMHRYVSVGETKGFLGIGRRAEGRVEQAIVKNIKNQNKAERREKSALRISTHTNGMLQPFEISDDEIGGKRERGHDPKHDPDRKGKGKGKGKGRERG